MHQYQQKHKGQPMLVLGTGPSAWDIGRRPEFVELLNGMPTIGINRAFGVGLRVNYQISLDRIWQALLSSKPAKASYNRLSKTFVAWKTKHGTSVRMWTLEDFVAAYRDKLEIHPEVQTYLRLCSPHAPFTRFIQTTNFPACPYGAIAFNAVLTVDTGRYTGLFNRGNTGHAAVHLAALMGANPIFLLGVDMAPPDATKRPWERCLYAREGVILGFRILREKIRGTIIYNLNPKAALDAFSRVKSHEDALDILKRYQHAIPDSG